MKCPLCNKELNLINSSYICKNKKCKIYMPDYKIVELKEVSSKT